MAKTIERSALVPFSAQQMYCLVNDIESFPAFMDGCVGSEILSQSAEQMEARLDLRKGKFEQSFATRNTLTANQRIDMALTQGEAFKTLSGTWLFQDLGLDAGTVGSKLSLSLHFEFKNRLFALAADPWFEKVANQLVDSICQRAHQLYGN